MSELKIGDDVFIKKLSEEEYYKLSNKYGNGQWIEYDNFLYDYKDFFNTKSRIVRIDPHTERYIVDKKRCFYKEELIKVNSTKQNLKRVLNEL